MPVTATPVEAVASTRVISNEELREFLRDYSDKNPLLDDVEFSDHELEVAVNRTVDLANIVDRPTQWTVESFPNKLLLLMGAASYLMQSESFRQIRNEASYQDGNIQPVGIDNKQQAYAAMSQALRGEFRSMVSQIKISENMNATGFFRSPIANKLWRL